MRSKLSTFTFLSLIFSITFLACNNKKKDIKVEQTTEENQSTSGEADLPIAVDSSTADNATQSDEFTDPSSLSSWFRLWQVEKWPHDQLESIDIGSSRDGWLTMMPYTSAWYGDYRGVLMFRQISGNFIATTHLEVSNRAKTGAPERQFSLAGILVRQPKTTSAAAWQAATENYIFLALGSATNPGTFQTEVKTTINSDSTLNVNSTTSGVATIRIARLGSAFILLIKPSGGSWEVHRRYSRNDFGESLQVGLTTYTDWENIENMAPDIYNNNQITDGQPDLLAQFDYMRLALPTLPSSLEGLDLTDENAVPDAEILAFLGND